METEIIDPKKLYKNNIETEVIDYGKELSKLNTISFQEPYSISITKNKSIGIKSYIDNIIRNIYIKNLVSKGSFNDVFKFSYKKSYNYDRNYIIRISNSSSNNNNIQMELSGIKKQYNLCSKNQFIGQIIDFGKIYNPIKSSRCKLQEYSIQRKYGLSLSKVLSKNPKYKNIKIVLTFIKNFLTALKTIHDNGIAHLDLKPENILLKYRNTFGNGIFDNLDFVIIDFGAAKNFSNDKSKVLEEQMASAAFSPPELLERRYGKKSDIWAFGVICYLVMIRKNFLKAKAQYVFLGKENEQISNNIKKAINSLLNNLLPKYVKKNHSIKEYIYPLKKSQLKNLESLFDQTFKVDITERANSTTLLNNKLFNLI